MENIHILAAIKQETITNEWTEALAEKDREIAELQEAKDNIISQRGLKMWKPEVGDYAVSKRTNKLYLIGEIDAEHKRFMLPNLLMWCDFDDFRPAVLSDFAVEIEGKKYWCVEIGNCIDMITDDKDHCIEMSFYQRSPVKRGISKAVITYYNITVMPETLWKKLTEENNAG